ncbi:MAG: efflux transporter outer membrane subunit [Thermoguttaceae bacterium]|jgi:NodT family efflux transporter outer membrane factor (OMF) lipoprotein
MNPELRGKPPLALAFAAVLLLGGCTSPREYLDNGFKVGPNYSRPQAPVAEHWIDEADQRLREDSQIPCRWWTVLKDPVLDGLIVQASTQNLTLRQAGFRILEARAQLGIARGDVFPQQQFMSGGYDRLGAGGSFLSQWNWGFTLAWELDFWGRFRRAVQAADAQLDASIAGYDDVLVTLLADVANNYVTIRVRQEQIRLLDENIAIQQFVLTVGEERLRAGTITSVDVDQVRSNLLQNQAQREQLYVSLRQTSDALSILLGQPPRNLVEELGAGSIPAAPTEVAVGIPADLLRRRPDVRRAERRVAAQAEQIGIATADLYPAIAIHGSLGYQAQNLSHLFTSDAFTGSVGPSFRWDLLNYGRLANNIYFQNAALGESVAFYQDTVLAASAEVEDGFVFFLRAQERARLYDQSAAAARSAVDAIQGQLLHGRIDYNQYATIQQTLIQTQTLAAQAHGDIAFGLIQVYRALGGGWEIRQANWNSLGGVTGQGAAPDAGTRPAKELEAVPKPPAESK